MSLNELRKHLEQIAENPYEEQEDHMKADRLLLEYIGDDLVSKYFREIPKWYA